LEIAGDGRLKARLSDMLNTELLERGYGNSMILNPL
jgi:hypothetical protein